MTTPIKHIRIPENVTKNIEKYKEYNNFSSFSQATITALTIFFKEHPVPTEGEN